MDATHTTPSTAPEAGRAPARGEDVVSRLQQSDLFRDYQDAFQTATGLPLALRAAGSFRPPLHGCRLANGLCSLMQGCSRTCASCLEVQQLAESGAVDGPKTVQCLSGLCESLVPIRVGERVLAYLQTGQVRLRAPSERAFQAALARLAERGAPVDPAAFRTAFFAVRVLPRVRYLAALRLLGSFAHHLALLSNELMIRSAAAEPPAAVRARAFIAEHLGEPLALEQVARAANMSPFYFCKVFKQATGLTFTHYVARARVERTKQLLLNPHARISEAAYEAGFQSLSQFNRVFRRIAGEAPTRYRVRLHGAAARHPMPFAA